MDTIQVETISRESALLSAEVRTIKTYDTALKVNEEILKRARFRTKIKREDAALSKRAGELKKTLADIKALRDILEISDDSMKTDISELDDVRWSLIHAEKEATKPFSKPTDEA